MVPVLILAGVALVGLIVFVSILHSKKERRRRSAIWTWAQINGFEYHETDPFNLDQRFNGFASIGRGHSRYAFEILNRTDPVPAYIFRYHFATTETRTVTHTDANGHSHTTTETYEQDHWRSYLILELGAKFPDLFIRPEGWGDKIASLAGFDDINFESEEFSRKYHIKSKDRQFAYALIHPEMMEFLLPRRFSGRLEKGRYLADIELPGEDAASRHHAWMTAAGFINRIPAFVWQDYGGRPAVQLPSTSAPVPITEPGSDG